MLKFQKPKNIGSLTWILLVLIKKRVYAQVTRVRQRKYHTYSDTVWCISRAKKKNPFQMEVLCASAKTKINFKQTRMNYVNLYLIVGALTSQQESMKKMTFVQGCLLCHVISALESTNWELKNSSLSNNFVYPDIIMVGRPRYHFWINK